MLEYLIEMSSVQGGVNDFLPGVANCQLHMHHRKSLPSSSTHHPFVPTPQTIPVSVPLAQGSEKVLWSFCLCSTLSKSQPWCFCNSTLAVVVCSLGSNLVRTPAPWAQIPPVSLGCPGCAHVTLITGCLAGYFENSYQAPSSVPGIDLQISMHFVPFNSYFNPGM